MSDKYLPPRKNLPKTMLVDMNSFFASVEQQANPKLRGIPVGVCASLHETSCLIATSKEAKTLGIKIGTLTYKAKKIYPKIILLESEPEKYRAVHKNINKIFRDYTDKVEAYSIDESFLDLTGAKDNPLWIGREIKRRILEEVGEWLTCSVGVGQNKFLAKLAAEFKKPDGLSIIWRENLPQVYQHCKLSDLWGIARGWERRLGKLGIVSPLQLLDYPVQNLISVFGKPGFYLWQRVNGLEQDEIGGEADFPKSFGHSWVLNFRTVDKEKFKPVILRLAEKAARRMRANNFTAYGICLSVTLVDGTHFAKSAKLKFPADSGLALYYQALKFWQTWKITKDVLHIAVRFTNLTVRSRQLGLFDDKQFNLMTGLDYINDKYGEFTIRSGLLTATQAYAPDAIAFGR
jgi:DNA polymerase-4